jgi:hypothetical protein
VDPLLAPGQHVLRRDVAGGRKHQRLPPSLLIENASDQVSLCREGILPEAFPIKPSDDSGAIDKHCAVYVPPQLEMERAFRR